MKKAALALTTIAALSASPLALADEPDEQASRISQATPVPSTGGPSTSPVPPMIPPGGGASTSPVPPAGPATTTITSADVSPAPMPPPLPPERDTITVRESYRPNRPLLYTGSTMFLASYGATAAMTAIQNVRDGNGDQSTYIPVAGPWIHLANTKENTLNTALIAGSGIAQGAGVLISALSLIVPEKVPVATIQAGSMKVTLTATSYGRGSAGLGAVGQF